MHMNLLDALWRAPFVRRPQRFPSSCSINSSSVQLGRDLSDDDVSDIIAFLETLTGDVPEQFAMAPVLPIAPFTK